MEARLEAVTLDIGGVRIVSRATLHAAQGDIIGIVGPNGSGKSTLLRAVYRSARPTSGAVLVGGQDVWRSLTSRAAARRTSVLAQESPAAFDFTVAEVVAAGRTPHRTPWSGESAADRDIVAGTLDRVGMAHLADRPYASLSGGEKQRVLLARALAQQGRLLVLDEPTNHLDIGTQLDLLELVRDLGVTTLAALHDLNLAAAYCDRVHVLHGGLLVASGPPDEVFTRELLAEVFQVHAALGTHPLTGRPQLSFAPLPATIPLRPSHNGAVQ
ncbi:ABC transporter ATP-binding protein [Streptomyces graminilatus]|uniref:ABC transporter ATP-binding protein n=1 Tax=Streptomyces graminilatus TaxID=1464070 RepID=UPI0006E319C1|nr:ABC transporter ATP-binding protein [Streptomyces graminilatus]